MAPKGYKSKKTANRNKAKNKTPENKAQIQAEILRLIESVADDDLAAAPPIPVPSDEQLDKQNFPIPHFPIHSMEYLDDNLPMLCSIEDDADWLNAWFEILKERNDGSYGSAFASFSTDEQKELRDRMVKIITAQNREIMYQKYMHAVRRDGLENLLREDSVDTDTTTDAEQDTADTDVVDADEATADTDVVDVGVVNAHPINDAVGVGVHHDLDQPAVPVPAVPYPFRVGDDDLFPANASQPLESDDFPIFRDGDGIPFYRHPFSLGSWYRDHLAADSRWLDEYPTWGGSKLNRETSAIIQALITSVLNHLGSEGAHGRLEDLYNYKLTQVIRNHVGSAKVKVCFEVELLNRDPNINARDKVLIENDMQQFIGVLHLLMDGSPIDDELAYLFESLNTYPSNKDVWKKRFLSNYPGLWDASERCAFFINFYAQYLSDTYTRQGMASVYILACTGSLLGNRRISLWNWQCNILRNSVLDHVLRDTAPGSPMQAVGDAKYSEGHICEIVRFISACIQDFRPKPGGSIISLRKIDFELSRLFPWVLLCIFAGMCHNRCFLS